MRALVLILTVLPVAACLAGARTPPARGPDTDSCGAGALAPLVGQTPDRLPPFTGARRILPPGSVMTMDFAPSRQNVDLDASGRVTRIWCG